MKPLFTDYTPSELNSTKVALEDSIRRRNWLPEMKPFWLRNLRKVKAEIENRKGVKEFLNT